MKYFVAVCEFKTVSLASEYLRIAQPSVSIAIKELEKEFGVILFNRKHRGMELTSEGKTFYALCKDLIERVEHAEKIMKDLGQNKKTLKLGVPPMIGSLILPIIYEKFVSKQTDLEIEIIECGREEMLKKLEEDKLDMAFISHDKDIGTDINSLLIDELEIVCTTANNNAISQKEILTAKDLEGIPLVMFKDGFYQSYAIKAWFNKESVRPNVLIKTDQLSTMIKIIKSNTAVGFCFKKLIEKESEINYSRLSPSINAKVSVIWNKNKFFSYGMRKFKEFILSLNVFN
jgi:DNA-binding transcriptional LysR family regulator